MTPPPPTRGGTKATVDWPELDPEHAAVLREDLTQPASYPPALPWAALMDAEDLTEALGEIWYAVRPIAEGTEADARQVLAELESVLGSCRALAEAQYAHNTSWGPDAEAGETS